MRARLLLTLPAFALGCGLSPQPQPPGDSAAQPVAAARPADSPAAAATGITGREWTLVALGDDSDEPLEETARPVTLRLDEASGRATGYAGCNRYGGPYTLSGDNLHFGPAAMTKMACRLGMSTEQRFAAALTSVARFRLEGSTLVLLDADGKSLATFRGR